MPKKKNAEQMIEELALSVGRGLAATASKDDVKELASVIRQDLDGLRQQIDKVAFNTSGLDRRLSTVEDRVLQLARAAGLKLD